MPASTSCSSRSTTVGGGRRADVGEDQRLLQPLPGLVVESGRRGWRRSPRRAPGGSCERLSRRRRKTPRRSSSASVAGCDRVSRAPRSTISCQVVGTSSTALRRPAGLASPRSPQRSPPPRWRCRRGVGLFRLGRDFARQAPGDDLGDAVAAHADPVEDVGGVHRAFLVGDDDELGAVGEAADQLQEAVDVGVVEGGLDLVEDVEGARAGEEDGEDEGERDQRLLAAGEQRELAGRLAGRGDLDLDPELLALLFLLLVARAPSLGLGSPPALGVADRPQADPAQAPAAAREEVLDHLLEVLARSPRRSPRRRARSRGRCRGSAPPARASPRSVSSRWACSASTCSRASSYSRSASGLTGPIWARRRSSRSSRRSISARSSSVSGCSAGADLLAEPLGDRGQLPGRLGAAVAEVGRLDLGLGQLVGGRLHLGLQLELALRAGAHLLGDLVAVALAADHRALGPLDPGADRGAGRLDRRGGGAHVVEQLLAGGDRACAAPRGGARRAGPRRGGRGGRRARRRRGRAPSADSRAASAASAERARARPSTARAEPGVDLAQLLLQLAGPLAGAPPRRRRRASAGPSSARSASRLAARARPRGRRGPRRGPRSAPARRAAWSAGPRPGCARGRGRRSAPRRRGGARSTSASRSSSPVARRARLLRRLLGRGGPVGAEAQLLGDQPRRAARAPRARSARPARPPAPGASAAAAGRAPRARGRARGRGCRAAARSFSSARRRRLRCLPRPAASSTRSRRSRGLEWTIDSTRPWLITECISRPRLVSERTSTTSTSRQRAPFSR